MAERYGLFTLIVLGESVPAATIEPATCMWASRAPQLLHEEQHCDDHPKRDHDAPQDARPDLAGEPATERTAEKGTDRHHRHCRPDDVAGAREEDRRGAVGEHRQGLFKAFTRVSESGSTKKKSASMTMLSPAPNWPP